MPQGQILGPPLEKLGNPIMWHHTVTIVVVASYKKSLNLDIFTHHAIGNIDFVITVGLLYVVDAKSARVPLQ